MPDWQGTEVTHAEMAEHLLNLTGSGNKEQALAAAQVYATLAQVETNKHRNNLLEDIRDTLQQFHTHDGGRLQ